MRKAHLKLSNFNRGIFLLGAVATLVLTVLFSANILNTESDAKASANNNLANVMPAKMTRLELGLVYAGGEIDNTINSTQSFTITDKYFIAVQAHSVNENTGWIVATSLKNPSAGPVWKKSYNVGHGNGATWNSKTNQIVIVDRKNRLFLNADNGNYISKSEVGTHASGIAFAHESGNYIETNGSSTSSGRILDSSFKTLKTFDAGHRLVNQDVAYHDGFIYRVGWAGCDYLENNNNVASSNYCRQYFGNNSNVLYKFDLNGDFVEAFYIDAGFGELESLDFGPDGTPYLMFNGKPDYLHYSVYKVTNQNALNKMKGKSSTSITFTTPAAVVKTYQDQPFINKAQASSGGAITYQSTNPKVATVDAKTGQVTIKSAGTTTIKATSAETARYKSASSNYILTVNKKDSAAPAEISKIKTGNVGDKLSSIKLSTSCLNWRTPDTKIKLGNNKYNVSYTENNDTVNFITKTYEITVNGISKAQPTTPVQESKPSVAPAKEPAKTPVATPVTPATAPTTVSATTPEVKPATAPVSTVPKPATTPATTPDKTPVSSSTQQSSTGAKTNQTPIQTTTSSTTPSTSNATRQQENGTALAPDTGITTSEESNAKSSISPIILYVVPPVLAFVGVFVYVIIREIISLNS